MKQTQYILGWDIDLYWLNLQTWLNSTGFWRFFQNKVTLIWSWFVFNNLVETVAVLQVIVEHYCHLVVPLGSYSRLNHRTCLGFPWHFWIWCHWTAESYMNIRMDSLHGALCPRCILWFELMLITGKGKTSGCNLEPILLSLGLESWGLIWTMRAFQWR